MLVLVLVLGLDYEDEDDDEDEDEHGPLAIMRIAANARLDAGGASSSGSATSPMSKVEAYYL